ncbi:MAG: adenylate/guanylate cyclase domain-containing protein [Chlamydiales bacterium]|nr:adenylate/guanylate cyclase domain-containing protein [Chlamydiales bacterium]
MHNPRNIQITLAQLFSISLIVLIALLCLLFYVLLQTSRTSIMQAADNLRESASRELAEKVTSYLNQAEHIENSFQTLINHQVINPNNSIETETTLFSLLLTNNNLSEISFIYGDKIGYDAEGNILLAQMGRGEMSLFRTSSESSAPIDTRYIYQKNEQWVFQSRLRSAQNDLFGRPFTQEKTNSIIDPTTHLTFMTPASEQYSGTDLWSDLHWSQVDDNLPENKRHVELSLQRTVTDVKGKFLGVLRIGLFSKQIDMISQFKLLPHDPNDAHIVFIADRSGELITRLNATDTPKLIDGNLRFSSANALPEIQLSLKNPSLGLVTATAPVQTTQFDYQGKTYLVTYREIKGSQDWILGILVPQSYYVGSLEVIRNRLLLATAIIMLSLCIGGYFVQRLLKGGQAKIIHETLKMHNFDFVASEPRSIFRDVYEILLSLELAKTAMRAMGKYVPIQLVKQLYQSQKDPTLGGEVQEVSILFTDIQNFTSIAEKLPVSKLAAALGEYLRVMTYIIQNNRQGTIDKYIGDGIMALWNAPVPLPNHAQAACQAVLDCAAALQKLFTSPQWTNLPRLDTRFGLHKDLVIVGNFGAPDRLNFTAIGNGVNIASRLESLNKQYGTSMLVSEDIYESAKELFIFRLLDLVAVKGKTEGINVYELIGKKGEKPEMNEILLKYEQAFKAYQSRNFKEAINLLKDQLSDNPSNTLHARCTLLLQTPPPDSWNGIYISAIK